MNQLAKILVLKSQLAKERRARKKAEIAVRKCTAELHKVQTGNTSLQASFNQYTHKDEQGERAEKRYEYLYNFSQALICTHDMEGKLLSVNPASCRVMGYSESELVGKFIHDCIPKNMKPYFRSEYLASIQREDQAHGVLGIENKDGDIIYLLFENHKVVDDAGEAYVISFSQNITKRILIEQELLLAKKGSEEVAHAKETFLANMSHEIRTPINGILGMAGLLAKTELNSRQQNFLKLIQDSGNNLLMIVNDVLDLEKIIAGKLTLEQIPFKMVDKISMIVQSFIYRAEEKGLAVIYQNSIPGDLVIVGDPFRLSQVLNNILSNAIKFTETGNITITTGIESYQDEKANIKFIIKDSGIGISEDKIKDIFKPFVQADPAISRKYGGTGLGLTICKNLLEMQNGILRVESELNVGSTFSFSLPFRITDEEVTSTDETQDMDYQQLGRKKILVAEDIEINQFLAKHIMEAWGFEVALANNGREAVKMVAENDYDMVLMDVQMPEMDGVSATNQIRRMSDRVKASLPIIALTANALKGDSEKYIAAGMTDYLSKPFDEDGLYDVITRNLPVTKTKPIYMKEAQPLVTESSANGKLYDLSTIRMVSGDDEEFVKKMICLFIETVPVNMKELNAALDKENWDMVSKSAHKLKSTLDSMGIHSLKQDIRTVEANAKLNESVSVIPALVQRINTVIKKCISQLEEEILHPVF